MPKSASIELGHYETQEEPKQLQTACREDAKAAKKSNYNCFLPLKRKRAKNCALPIDPFAI